MCHRILSCRYTRHVLMIMVSASAVSHFAFHSHSCLSSTAIRNLTSLLCNMPQAHKPLSIHTPAGVCVCATCIHVCVSNPDTLSECKHFHVFAKENWDSNFFPFMSDCFVCMHVNICVYLWAQNATSRDLSSPHALFLLLLELSSFPPKAGARYL